MFNECLASTASDSVRSPRRTLEGIDQKVDHHPHLRAEMATAGVDREDVDRRHAVARHHLDQSTGLHVLANHETRLPDDAGAGVIWQPSFVIGEDVQAGRLVEVMPGYRMPPIDILAIYASRRHLSAKVRVMVDFLVDALQSSPRGSN